MISKFFIKSEINSLRKIINKEENKRLFEEAALCLQTGALRSAFIMTWLCGAESLKLRIEKMAVRDAQIGKNFKEIKECEENGGSVDILILDTAKNLDLISQEEYENLDHVRTKRNTYAHPKILAPSSSEVIGALDQVVRYILSKPILLGFGYASETLRRIFDEEYLLDDVADKISDFGLDFAKKVDPKTHHWIIKKAIERLENIWDDPFSEKFKARGSIFLKSFIIEIKDLYSEKEWDYVDVLLEFPKSSSIIFSDPNYWDLLDNHSRSIIGNILSSAISDSYYRGSLKTSDKPSPIEAFNAIGLLLDKNKLSDEDSEKYNSSLLKADLIILSQMKIPLINWVDRVIEAMKSHNWYTQNPAINALSNVDVNEVAELDRNIQEELGRNILQCADGKANSALSFMDIILNDVNIWPEDFINGIIFECFFNEKGEIRMKLEEFPRIVNILLNLTEEKALSTLGKLQEILENLSKTADLNPSDEFQLGSKMILTELSKFEGTDRKISSERKEHISQIGKLLEEFYIDSAVKMKDDDIPF